MSFLGEIFSSYLWGTWDALIIMSMLTPKCSMHNEAHKVHQEACFCASLNWDRQCHPNPKSGNSALWVVQVISSDLLLSPLSSVNSKKFIFAWNFSEKNIIQSSLWDCLTEITQITMIGWLSQSFSRWWAAGEYRWRRQPWLMDNILFYIIYLKLR